MKNSKGITLLLMILIMFILTAGAASIANRIATDAKAARDYLEETKAFYVAWSSVANGKTWITSGGRRTNQISVPGACTAGTDTVNCYSSATVLNPPPVQDFCLIRYDGAALAAADLRGGGREYSYQILQPDNVNSFFGDGQIKVLGYYPTTDRIAGRDPRSQKALLEVTLWRDMKAFVSTLHVIGFFPANAIDADTTSSRWESSELAGNPDKLYVDFGQLESVGRLQVRAAGGPGGTVTSVSAEFWNDNLNPPNWSLIPGQSWPPPSPGPYDTFTSDAFTSVTTRRIRFTVTPKSGKTANLVDVLVCPGPLVCGGGGVRRQGTVRPGRFSFSTNYTYTQFN